MAGTDLETFLEFLPLFPTDDEPTILERMRGWANEGIDPANPGVNPWTDTREGSHWYVSVMPGVREMARLYDLAGTEVVMAGMVLWTWGSYLDDQAAVQQVFRLPATAAEGAVLFSGPAGTLIASGTQVGVAPVAPDDPAPLFQTSAGGTIPAPAAAPTGLAAAPSAIGGTLGPGTRAYVVTAVDDAGETLATAEVTAVVPAGGAGSVALTWNTVPTATGYRVYEGASGGPYSFLAAVAAPTHAYTDTGADVPQTTVHPPAANTTGGKLSLPITAVSAGADGNVGATAITAPSTPLPAGVSFTNPAATLGGTDPQDDDDLRARLLDVFAGGSGANQAYYRRLAEAEPGVGSAYVIPIWNGPGTVLIVVVDPQGQPVAASTVADLQAKIDPVAALGSGSGEVGAAVTVKTATALNLAITALVEFEPNYSLDGTGGTLALRQQMTDAITAYVSTVPPGDEVVIAKVQGAIVTVPGVHDVEAITVNGGTVNIPVAAGASPQVPVVSPAPVYTEGT